MSHYPITEQVVQDIFHSYLKSSLAQAKAERLLDADMLSSAEGDLMITGPALCLYFAALRCTTEPPSVPLPRSSTSSPIELSADNCPPAFSSFLRVWASTVPSIQSLPPEQQHDLARLICGLEPLSQPAPPAIYGISADLRAVAIEISQRRSFQDRYASDLQAALDSGGSSMSKKASFVPPPMYEPSPSPSPGRSPQPSPQPSPRPAGRPPIEPQPPLSPSCSESRRLKPHSPSPGRLSPSSASPTGRFPARSSSPTFLAPHSPAIEFIRETLYASLADVLERQSSLRRLLKQDPPRAYFASVAYAILDVATNAVTPEGSVVGVLGQPLTLADCPRELRPFMVELAEIGHQARALETEDDETAMKYAERGEDIPPSRMDKVRMMLEEGIGYQDGRVEAEEGRRSVEGRAVAFTNRINALSLGLTRLRAFKERQEDVFKVLAGIGS